jgi:lysozyme
MNENMKVSQAGVDLVKSFEGFRANAYFCPAGVPSIGYGHTQGVEMGQVVSEEEATQLLIEDLGAASRAVREWVKVPLNQNQFDALVSWTFNLGSGSLANSTLLRRLDRGEYGAVPCEMLRWGYGENPETGKSVELLGLVRRCQAEGALWATPCGKGGVA